MEAERWDAFLDWLSENGLLTTAVQSREKQVCAWQGPCCVCYA